RLFFRQTIFPADYFPADFSGRLFRQTFPADYFSGRLFRQTFPADFSGRLFRQTIFSGRLISYQNTSTIGTIHLYI
ncbi:MAG: hypothetical protein IKI22_01160, partial [Neisseriaceae bacterium]|nr:hypothetical protein [Neisseriaceae bacterium]